MVISPKAKCPFVHRFPKNVAGEDGGAIGLSFASGAIFGSSAREVHLRQNDKLVFNCNESNKAGGAIYADSFVISDNKEVVFEDNEAKTNGGAICFDDRLNDAYSYVFFEMTGNDSVVFRNNRAEGYGGAIYQSTQSYYNVVGYINGNKKVYFQDNQGGALYFKRGNIKIYDNEEVLFKGNKQAIRAIDIYLSAGNSSSSYIDFYGDYITATEDAYFNSIGDTINGRISFEGNDSYSTISKTASLSAGIMEFAKGSRMRVGSTFSLNGGNLIIDQYSSPLTVVLVGGDMNFGGSSGVLTFDLNYNMTTTQPLVNVGQYVNLIADSISIDDSGLNGNPAVIPLLSVGTTIGYNGKTYSFNDGVWSYTSNKITYTLPMDEILVNDQLRNGAKLEWVDKTLYYTISDTGTWEGHVKGLGEDRTWRGDELDYYDVNKKKVYYGKGNYDDSLLCWLASASNMIYYWQDKYAPLYQGDVLITNKDSNEKEPYDLLHYFIVYAGVKNEGGSLKEALKYYYLSERNRNSKFTKSLPTPWAGLGVGENNVQVGLFYKQFDDIQSVINELEMAFSGDSAIGLAIGLYETDDNGNYTSRTGGHAVTLWGAEVNGSDITMYITDSDFHKDKKSEMKIALIDKKLVITSYPTQGGDALSDANGEIGGQRYILEDYTYLTSPDGMDELLESYNNTKTLHWTGTAEGSRWEASSEMIGTEHHLADVHDGWKKECKGGGKTIYAHAYFTPANASGSSFVFADSVNGVTVTNKEVKLDDYLDVSNVLVSGKGYRFEGEGELRADAMTVSGNLTLADQVTIRDTPLFVSGVISVDNFDRLSPALEDCTITMDGGTLWCGGIKLVRADELGDVTIGRYEYNAAEANMQMQVCTVTGSGTFGCVIDLDGNVLDYANWAFGSKDELNEQFFHYIVSNNTSVAGKASDYDFEYDLTNAAIESNVDTIKECPLRLAAASLSISSSAGLLTIGSAGVRNAESAADITICEAKGASVDAGETALMTVPAEEVYLTQETSITASDLTVAEESRLTNEGRISGKVVVEAFGTLAGSGRFGSTTVYADGRVMVGSSPGAPVYESLTMHSGSELIFCLDGSTPASADNQGWGSGTHSVLTVTQPGGLTVESGTLVSVGCSLDFLNASPLGETQTLSLVQLSDAGSAELLNAMQSGTQFMLAEEDDTLSALIDVGAHVHDVQWAQGENNTLQLSFIVSSCPEDALVWTNGSGDGVWNESSQNWESLSGTASLFAAGRNVAFYKGGTVTLNGKVTVGDVVVSTAENLRWEGNGGIAGSGTLVKEGRGELHIASDNSDFSGSMEIYGGRVVAASSTSLGSATVVLDGGTRLIFCGNMRLFGVKSEPAERLVEVSYS